jgi:hypothetical protein
MSPLVGRLTFSSATFPSPWPIPLSKQDLQFLWKRVPLAGLYSNGGTGAAVNLDAALQTVNTVPIFGKPAGTNSVFAPASCAFPMWRVAQQLSANP